MKKIKTNSFVIDDVFKYIDKQRKKHKNIENKSKHNNDDGNSISDENVSLNDDPTDKFLTSKATKLDRIHLKQSYRYIEPVVIEVLS